MLRRLVLISDFKMIEMRVIEAVDRSRINNRTLVPIRSFEAQKSEAALRTCVYSRYAGLKSPVFKGFFRLQATPGLTVDCRQSHQDNVFCRRKGAATISAARQMKITIF